MSVEQVSGSAWAECPNGVESAVKSQRKVKVEHGEQGRFDEAERVILTLDESRSWHAAAQRGVFGTMPTCMPKGLNTLFNV